MKALLITAVTAATLALPVAALAATYQYVNTQGVLETETANNATDALTQPTDIALHSGVILVTNTIVTTPTQINNTGVPGTYTAQLTGVSTPARTMYLTLLPNGSVLFTSIYANSSTPSMTELGTWATVGTNQVQVTLTGNETQSYSPVQTLVFNQNGLTLTGTTFNNSIYGTQGLSFVK